MGKEKERRSDRDHRSSSSSSSSRHRLTRDEPPPPKRLRNEGEPPRGHGHTSSSSSSKSERDKGKDKVKVDKPPPATATPVEEMETQVVNVTPTLSKKDLYEAILEKENEEGRGIDPSKTVEEGRRLVSELEVNFNDILNCLEYPSEDPEELEDTMAEGLVKISSLRNVNKLLKLKLKCVKEDQLSVRNQVEVEHLLLQNLLYEATHLQNQVSAVQGYKGTDENIELIPVQEFFNQAPPNISKPDATKSDDHLLRISRLEYEFVQRTQLTEDIHKLEKEKSAVAASIGETQSALDSIAPMLNSVLEATKPLQKVFSLDISSKKEEAEAASYLPKELYVLLLQSNGFRDAMGEGKRKEFVVELKGNVEAAKELAVISPDEVEEDSDSDKEVDPEAEVSRRQLMRKKSAIHQTPEEARKKLLAKHPLWIEWTFAPKGGPVVFIQFFYIVKLKIVTVKSRILEDPSKVPEGPLNSSDALLDELFPEDTGLESPNAANFHQLQKVDCRGLADFVGQTGRAFLWAQKLGGVDYPLNGEEGAEEPRIQSQISAMHIGKVLRAIKARLSSQLTLCNQLKLLENRSIQIPPEAKDLFPAKICTAFKSWDAVSFSNYAGAGFSAEFLRTELVTKGNRNFYKACFERGKAAVTALVAISSDFPKTPPLFCVQLEKDGEKRNSANDPAIRDLEKEVNIDSIPEFEPFSEILLSLQLFRLMSCVDIILETDFLIGQSSGGPSEFAREKLFLRAASGRNNRRPFQYCGSGGGYFSQRY